MGQLCRHTGPRCPRLRRRSAGDPVTDPADGVDHLGVSEFAPEPADGDLDSPGEGIGVLVPDSGEKLLGAERGGRGADQCLEQGELLGGQIARLARARHRPPQRVELQIAGPQDARVGRRLPAGESPDSEHELGEVKRLPVYAIPADTGPGGHDPLRAMRRAVRGQVQPGPLLLQRLPPASPLPAGGGAMSKQLADEDLQRARAFVASVPWRRVREVPEGPLNKSAERHWYVILDWESVDTDEALWFAALIQKHGHRGRYVPPYSGKPQVNRYLDMPDGFVYWRIWPNQLCRTRIEFGQHERLPEQLTLDS
jgi:hypothetical protein